MPHTHTASDSEKKAQSEKPKGGRGGRERGANERGKRMRRLKHVPVRKGYFANKEGVESNVGDVQRV